MLKILFITIISLMFLGCNSTKHTHNMYKPFQMVSINDAILLQDGKDKQYCSICGMDLVRFYKTSHTAQNEQGKHIQYCSIHCLEDHLGEGIRLKNPQVVDVASLKFIPVGEAKYVVGSKKRGTMSMISKYAFKNVEDAKLFQSKNGGEIMDFTKAREIAQDDFKHYRD